MKLNPYRTLSQIDPMIYGQFLEHFHRQVYGGVFDPGNPLSDEDGFRTDVLEAMRRIKVPVIRWPGGCFVSAYHWEDGVGKKRVPSFNKAWRVPEPNIFGTDEYIKLCRKLGCEPYICTNAGTGTAEEMSSWVEYCNLKPETKYAMMRAENGHEEPFHVKYWSIGNENYGSWEIGSKTAEEWGHLVAESAKMMKRTDPSIRLSAAALTDMDWNANILKNCGKRLDLISIHGYWDFHQGKNILEDYDTCVGYIRDLEKPVREVKGLLSAFDCEHIKIAYDEWNLRAWYHPNIMDLYQGLTEDEYLTPRNDNDLNSQYTMADAVFSAAFLNMCIRNSDVIRMAAFSPIVNTRGMICTSENGLVLRPTYRVFELYVNEMENRCIDVWYDEPLPASVDAAATADADGKHVSVALTNSDRLKEASVTLDLSGLPFTGYELLTVNGPSENSYNDAEHTDVTLSSTGFRPCSARLAVTLAPHSVNVLKLR